jgi:glucose-6-phosphate 1-dehydrogenase
VRRGGGDSGAASAALRLQRLERLAQRPALGGGEAYTSAIASALLGRSEAFLSAEETDRLWSLWDGLIEEADARVGSGEGVEEYAEGAAPSWMRAREAGRTQFFMGGAGSAGSGSGSAGREL